MEAPRDLRAARLEKMAKMRELGFEPFPHTFRRTHACRQVHEAFGELEGERGLRVAGRLRAMRPMGKASFVHIEDATGRLQLYIRKDRVGEEPYRLLKLLDLGDLIGAEGEAFRTRTGEISLQADSIEVLAKAVRPLPVVKEKDGVVYDAFRDREARYRQRYLDLILNPDSREVFRRRAETIRFLRRYLDEMGFLEVETPILQSIYGGGLANPFKTHHRALEMDLYLRIAEELPLKKLIVGGLERVYELGRVFRNEGLDRQHNPEFTLLEFYWAYADYHDAMDLVEDMFRRAAAAIAREEAASYEGQRIDFAKPFARASMLDLIEEHTGVSVGPLPAESLHELCRKHGGEMPASTPRGKLIEKVFDLTVQPHLVQPTFVMDHPLEVSPLAKRHRKHADLVERFELFIAGMEFANAFTELNDPIDQRQRFEMQTSLREAGDEEAHPLDDEYVDALEHGMPPTAGVGIGIDRLVMLLTGSSAIRDVLLFPHMRPLEEGAEGAEGVEGAEEVPPAAVPTQAAVEGPADTDSEGQSSCSGAPPIEPGARPHGPGEQPRGSATPQEDRS